MPGEFLKERDRFVMQTLALHLHIPFFFVLAGGYQEPIEDVLVPLHLHTFETAAKVNGKLSQGGGKQSGQ